MGLFKDHATEIKVKVAASVIAGLLVASILGIVSFVPGVVPAVSVWLSKANPSRVVHREPEPAMSPTDQIPTSHILSEEMSQSGPGMLTIVRGPYSVFEMGAEFQERRKIRDYNKVVEIPAEKSGLPVASLPRGVFGFVDQRSLIAQLPEKNDAEKKVTLLNIQLRASRYGPGDWELHLTRTGEVFLVGVVDLLVTEELGRPLNDIRSIFIDSTIRDAAPRSRVVAVSISPMRLVKSEFEGRRLHFEVIKSVASTPSP